MTDDYSQMSNPAACRHQPDPHQTTRLDPLTRTPVQRCVRCGYWVGRRTLPPRLPYNIRMFAANPGFIDTANPVATGDS
jgi:hypothetical protein